MSFNNIQYQTSTHPHEQFDLSHDTITSAGFGEVQPTSVRLLPTVGKSTIKTSALVRLAPLVSPTWGRMWFHQYHQFVAIEDIFWQFPHFLSNIQALNNPVNGSLNDIKTLPSVTMGVLTEQFLRYGMCDVTCYEGATDSQTQRTKWVPCSTGGDKGIYSTIPHESGDWSGVGTSSRWVTSVTDPTSEAFVTPDNADFQPITNLNNSGNDYRMCIRLTNRGMRWYKLLLGCGYKPLWNNDSLTYVSLLPLMATYKAYWDIFRLPQYDNWEATALYRLIKWYDVHGVQVLDYYNADSPNMLVLQGIFDDFVDDCLEMFYTANQDYVSAHESLTDATGPRWHANQALRSVTYSPNGTLGTPTNASDKFSLSDGANQFKLDSNTRLGQLDIELLKKMYYWTNKASKIGFDIADVLKAKGLGQFVEENKERSNFIGSSRSPIKVNELLNTAETEGITADKGSHLGDYAGQSSQFDESKIFTYNNSQIGYVVSLCCVVPEPRQSMAMDPTILAVSSDGSTGNEVEFYNPIFDGFGMEYTPIMCIGHENFVVRNSDVQKETDTFGQIPRYTGWKVGQNIRNGMFASLANLDTFAPFHLDKMIVKGGKFRSIEYKSGAGVTPGTFEDDLVYSGGHEDYMPLAGRSWRFPTRVSGVGNYDRIFYDGGIASLKASVSGLTYSDFDRANDNFLIFMSYRHNASLAMLPLSRSWDTIEDDGGENHADGTASVRQ